MKDWIPQVGAQARKRGAFSHASKDLQTVAPGGHTNLGLRTGVWAPFRNDPHLVIGSGWGDAYRVAKFDGADGNFVGALAGVPTRPAYWNGASPMVIIPHVSGATVPPDKYYPASGEGATDFTVAVLGGTPPNAKIATTWGDFAILGRLATNFRRVQWSLAGNPENWPALGVFDAPEELHHIVARGNLHLLFGTTGVHALIGDTPPPGGNLTSRPFFFGQGTDDGRSVQVYGDYIIWANKSGVWKTDGTSMVDLTKAGGISRYWRSLAREVFATAATGEALTAGVYRGHYFITILTRGTVAPYPNIYRTLVCDIDRNVWFEWQGLEAIEYISRPSSLGAGAIDGVRVTGEEELFVVSSDHMTVEKLSPCWDTFGGKDPYTTTPLPSLETAVFKLGTNQEKRIRRAFITSDIRSVGGSVPTLQVSSVVTPDEAEAYGTAKTLSTTTKPTRRSVDVGRRGNGVAFKIEQGGDQAADISLGGIEIDGHAIEGSND
jgi:hypothetical protein